MTNDMSEHLRKLSSRNGRYWLRDTQKDATPTANMQDELPFKSVQDSQAARASQRGQHESVVVSIPNVQSTKTKPSIVPAATSVNISAETRVDTPTPTPAVPQTATVDSACAVPASAPAQMPPVRPEPIVFSDSVKIPNVEDALDDAVEAARATQTEGTNDSIGKIADEIVKQFPIAGPAVIVFAGSQATLQTDESCARVAAELASRNLGRVLLVDSDFVGRRLTKASGMSSQGGLSEVMNIAYPWQNAVLKSGSSRLDFMPAGNCPHKRWVPKEHLREAVAEIKRDYQFVCVSVGDAHDSASSTWADVADGAFLLISAMHSSDSVAESAVAQMRSDGSRLVGCIVADVSEATTC